MASTVLSDAAGSWCRAMVAGSSGSPRRYLAGVALSFGVGVGYALLGATMVASTTADPYQPSPGMAALADVFIWVLLGLISLPLVLGGIFHWALRTQGVAPAPGCASILLSAVSGTALTLGVGFASSTLTPPRLYGGWVESRPAGYSVHLASPGNCSSHPAMHFAPGAVGAYVPTAGCCSIVWWSEGRSDAAEWSDPGPVVLHQPKGSPTQWNDLDGFADYLAGAEGLGSGVFTRTESPGRGRPCHPPRRWTHAPEQRISVHRWDALLLGGLFRPGPTAGPLAQHGRDLRVPGRRGVGRVARSSW